MTAYCARSRPGRARRGRRPRRWRVCSPGSAAHSPRTRRLTYRLGKLRDSLAAAKAELDTLPRNAPAYARIHGVFGRLSDSLSAGQARAERARDELDRARREFVTRSDSLRLRMRQWEDSTYQGYDSIVRGLSLRAGHDAVTDTTGADGWAHLKLPPGRWWVYARSWDATDPNAEWYWNLPVTERHPAAVEPQRAAAAAILGIGQPE